MRLKLLTLKEFVSVPRVYRSKLMNSLPSTPTADHLFGMFAINLSKFYWEKFLILNKFLITDRQAQRML